MNLDSKADGGRDQDSSIAGRGSSITKMELDEKHQNLEDLDKFDRVKDLSTWRRITIIASLAIGLFLSLMDTSIMATAVYRIALQFDSLGNTFWAVIAYQVAYLGFAGIFCRMSDFWGRRPSVIMAFILFIAFSFGAAWAQTITQLIVFRTFQGIGGAGLYSLALILMIEVSTPRMVPAVSAIFGATIAISGVLGPVIGGLFTEYATWRWIFWLNAPCATLGITMFLIGWPGSAAEFYENRSWRAFDLIGAILMLAASVLVVFGLQEAGQGAYGWASATVLSSLIVGVACWLLLFAWEYLVDRMNRPSGHRQPRDIAPMFPFSILTNRPLLAGIISTMLTGFTFFLVIISLPLRFQLVNHKSPAAAGVGLLPMLAFAGFGSFMGGALARDPRRLYPTFLTASALVLLGTGLLSTLGTSDSIQAKAYGFQVILGLGVGLTFSTISIMTALDAPHKDHAVIQGIVAQMRVFGGSMGVATSNAVFNAVCTSSLLGVLSPLQIHQLQSDTQVLRTLSAAQRNEVRLAYAKSFEHSLRICTYIAAACLVTSALTWKRAADRKP